jgi:hypothetical protein
MPRARRRDHPWWLAEEQDCPACRHRYALTAEVRCVACDEPMCPSCAVLVREVHEIYCPDCKPARAARRKV